MKDEEKKETIEELIKKLSKEYTAHDISMIVGIPEGWVLKFLKGEPLGSL